MEMVNIKINGMPLSVPAGTTILEAARMHGIEIPTLCYLKRNQRDRRLPHLRGRGQSVRETWSPPAFIR